MRAAESAVPVRTPSTARAQSTTPTVLIALPARCRGSAARWSHPSVGGAVQITTKTCRLLSGPGLKRWPMGADAFLRCLLAPFASL